MLAPSSLTLLMLRVGADDHYAALALDHLALITHGFYRRSDLHIFCLPLKRRLFRPPCYAALGEVIGRHLHGHLISRQNADEIHTQLA